MREQCEHYRQGKHRLYHCVDCGEQYRVFTRAPLPKEYRRCGCVLRNEIVIVGKKGQGMSLNMSPEKAKEFQDYFNKQEVTNEKAH